MNFVFLGLTMPKHLETIALTKSSDYWVQGLTSRREGATLVRKGTTI